VPQKASRAVVMSLLCGVVYSTFVTALFYWLGVRRFTSLSPVCG